MSAHSKMAWSFHSLPANCHFSSAQLRSHEQKRHQIPRLKAVVVISGKALWLSWRCPCCARAGLLGARETNETGQGRPEREKDVGALWCVSWGENDEGDRVWPRPGNWLPAKTGGIECGRLGVVFAEAGGRCQSLSMTGRATEGRNGIKAPTSRPADSLTPQGRNSPALLFRADRSWC